MTGSVRIMEKPQPLKFTRAFRRQLFTIDLTAMLLIHVRADQLKDPAPLEKSKRSILSAFKALVPTFPVIPMTSRDEKRFKRIEKQVKDAISKCVVKNAITPDFVNAIYLLVEKAHDESKKGRNKPLIDAWDGFFEHFNAFFYQIDPNGSDEKWSILGDRLTRDIEKIIDV